MICEQHLDYKRKPQSFWYQESCCLFADSTDSHADMLTVQVFMLGMLCHLSPFSQKKQNKSAKQHVSTCFWITHLHRQTFSPFLHVFGQWVMQYECDLIIILTGHDPGYIYVLHVSRRTADCRMSTALVKKYVQRRKQREWAYFRISSENCTLVTRGISTARVCMFVVLLNTNTV